MVDPREGGGGVVGGGGREGLEHVLSRVYNWDVLDFLRRFGRTQCIHCVFGVGTGLFLDAAVDGKRRGVQWGGTEGSYWYLFAAYTARVVQIPTTLSAFGSEGDLLVKGFDFGAAVATHRRLLLLQHLFFYLMTHWDSLNTTHNPTPY